MLVCWSEGSLDKAGLLTTCVLRGETKPLSILPSAIHLPKKEGWEKEGVGGAAGQAGAQLQGGARLHGGQVSTWENTGRSGAGQGACAWYLLRGTG